MAYGLFGQGWNLTALPLRPFNSKCYLLFQGTVHLLLKSTRLSWKRSRCSRVTKRQTSRREQGRGVQKTNVSSSSFSWFISMQTFLMKHVLLLSICLLLLQSTVGFYDGNSEIRTLDLTAFENSVPGSGIWLIEFYAPW